MRPPPPKKKACVEDADAEGAEAVETGGESMLTIGSSFCGSNHVQTTTPPPRSGKGKAARARDAATVTSSSMQQPRNCAAAHRSGKRKQRDGDHDGLLGGDQHDERRERGREQERPQDQVGPGAVGGWRSGRRGGGFAGLCRRGVNGGGHGFHYALSSIQDRTKRAAVCN